VRRDGAMDSAVQVNTRPVMPGRRRNRPTPLVRFAGPRRNEWGGPGRAAIRKGSAAASVSVLPNESKGKDRIEIWREGSAACTVHARGEGEHGLSVGQRIRTDRRSWPSSFSSPVCRTCLRRSGSGVNPVGHRDHWAEPPMRSAEPQLRTPGERGAPAPPATHERMLCASCVSGRGVQSPVR